MNRVTPQRRNATITAAVWLHAAVTASHSAAHVGAGVWMSLPATVYIWLVIIIGPIVGWWLLRSGRACSGSVVVTVCMTGALAFGALNHFVWSSPDHINSIGPGLWRRPFQATAILLALTEAMGVVAGVRGICGCRHRRREP